MVKIDAIKQRRQTNALDSARDAACQARLGRQGRLSPLGDARSIPSDPPGAA